MISPGEEAPPGIANAYTTKEGGAQTLPNANPETPIVLALLPYHQNQNKAKIVNNDQ